MVNSFSKLTNPIGYALSPGKTPKVFSSYFSFLRSGLSIAPWKDGEVLQVKCSSLTVIKIWEQVNSIIPYRHVALLGLVPFGGVSLH